MTPLEKILEAVSCSTCAHFDGDCHCALPIFDQILGHIKEPAKVVCVKWEGKEEEK